MDLVKLLHDTDGGAGMTALAQSFGLSKADTEKAVASVLPEMSARLERNMLSRGGVADLVAMLGAAQAKGVGRPEVIGTDVGRQQGDVLLEQLFGTRDKSRAVAAKASYASGIGESVIKAMLPYIASMVINAIFKRTSGGLGDILSKIPNMGGKGGANPGGPAPDAGPTGRGRGGGGLDDIFSRIPDLGGNPPIDASRAPQAPLPGNDTGFETGGRMGSEPSRPRQTQSMPGGGASLPLPEYPGRGGWGTGGEARAEPQPSNPYGDLSDIIRRGGAAPEAAAGGGALWRIVRGLIGGALGFQSRGILGWLFRLIVLRFGSSILRTIFRRLIGGR